MEDLTIFEEHIPAGDLSPREVDGELVLRFEQRQKARQRARLRSNREIGIALVRGTILRGGDFLKASGDLIVRVVAAPEPVSSVTSHDPLLLARAAYHLGNRHVHLQVGPGFLRYLADHVLDHMVESLGLSVTREELPFEPEAGAYALGRSQGHGHGHRDDHEH